MRAPSDAELARGESARSAQRDLLGPVPDRLASTDWREYVVVIRRRWLPALLAFIVVVAASAIHGMTRVPLYQAKVRLLIASDRSILTGVGDPLAQGTEVDFQTQLTILQSRSLARRTMQALGAWQPPGGSASNVEAPAAAPDSATASAQIDGFLAAIRVAPIPGSRLIDVYYTSHDPNVAARYASTLADQYIRQTLDDRSAASKDVTDWLTDRLADQRKTLEASETSLQGYREKNTTVATRENTTLLVQKLTDLIAAFTKAKTDRIEKGALYTQVQSLTRDPDALEAIPPILSNPFVQQLKVELTARQREEAALAEKLGARHPALIKAREATLSAQSRLRAEVTKGVEAIRQDYAAAQATETQLSRELDAQKLESLALNRSDVQLAVLQRDAESNRQIYDNLNQRVNEFAVVRQRRGSSVSVVDPAEVPQSPVGPGAWGDLRYGILGGLVLAFGVAFLLEQIDNHVKTPHQIKELGFPLLGLVPRVDPTPDTPRPLTGSHTPASFNEAFRTLRTNVRLSTLTDGPRTILVTSPGSGDGKSLVAANLAVTIAQGNHRVVLVDCDLRRPTLHTTFGEPLAPGLSEVLTGQAVVSDAVRPAAVPLLPSGTHPPNPSELLDSDRFSQTLRLLRETYDWVIIDSPPVMPVTDALILASAVDDVIIVASAEVTPLPALRGTLEQLGRAPSRILGVVLNRVDLQRRAYYYSDYYHRDYDRYYVKDQPDARKPS
jgi:capsular exopolysaccharide synthesis family protein